MTIPINAPDGSTVNFPDGTDDATIKNVMGKNYPTSGRGSSSQPAAPATGAPNTVTPPAATPSVPGSKMAAPSSPATGAKIDPYWAKIRGQEAQGKNPVGRLDIPPEPSFGLGFRHGVRMPILNAAVALETGLKGMGVPMDAINKGWAAITGQKESSAFVDRNNELQYIQDEAKSKPGGIPGRSPSLAGELTGQLPIDAELLAITKNPWLIGAAQGALNSDSKSLKGVAADTAIGAIGGKMGDVGVKALGAVTSPIWRPTVNKLLKEGVELTPGQITGGPLHRLEDASMSFPILGDVVQAASKRGEASFSNAAVNRSLNEIGQKLPKDIPAGHQAVAHAQQAFGNEYDNILPQIKIRMNGLLHSDLNSLEAQAQQDLPADHFKSFQGMLTGDVIAPFNRAATVAGRPNAPLTGDALKDMDGALNQEIRQFKSSANPYDRKYADYVADLKQTVHDHMGVQNPTLKPRLDAVDRGYQQLVIAEKAAAPANQGSFSPRALQAATLALDTSARKRASAAGGAKMQDLAIAGQDAMNRTIPESGTAYRAAINTGAGAALFGLAPHIAVNPLALGGAAALLAPYTKTGGRVVRALMTQRPAWAAQARALIDKGATPASIATPAALLHARNARLTAPEEQ